MNARIRFNSGTLNPWDVWEWNEGADDIQIDDETNDDEIIICWVDNLTDYDRLPAGYTTEWTGENELSILNDDGETVEIMTDFKIERV